MGLPHARPLDAFAADEIGAIVARLEAIDHDLDEREDAGQSAVRSLLEHRVKLSRELRAWLKEFGGTPKARADFANRLASSGAGSHSYQATYNGNDNYTAKTGACATNEQPLRDRPDTLAERYGRDMPGDGLDAEKIRLLNQWAEGLQHDERAEVSAAGRAILMLIDEVERLHVHLWDQQLNPPGRAEAVDAATRPEADVVEARPELEPSLRRRLRARWQGSSVDA
jgi:hypothetical protein